MKIKYIGPTISLSLTQGKVYEVLSIEKGWYRIIDDEGIEPGDELLGYLYPPKFFEVVEE